MTVLTGELTNGRMDDKWSVEYYDERVEIWCESVERHSIQLDMQSMVRLRDMINDILWRKEIE